MNLKEKSQCPACLNNDLPTGAHKCATCKKAVHIFDTCSSSIPGEVEGYGEQRICFDCLPSFQNELSEPNSRELEVMRLIF